MLQEIALSPIGLYNMNYTVLGIVLFVELLNFVIWLRTTKKMYYLCAL
jgi:hypothetical protein